MAISRRHLLAGSLSGAGILLLSACTEPSPGPTASRAPQTPTPTPTTPLPGITPTAFRRSSWGTDPYAYGSASRLTASSTDADRTTLRGSLADKLFFAGEAVAATEPGTVMGARSSGLQAAAEVAAVAQPGERIAVVGAGMAGATAARDLADRGFDVVVVEARHRIGGRIASYTGDEWPIEVQLGVSTLFGDGARALTTLLEAGGVTEVPLTATQTARAGSTTTAAPASGSVLRALAEAESWAAKRGGVTVAEALTSSGAAGRLSSTPDAAGVSDRDRLAFVLDDLVPARFGLQPDALSGSVLDETLVPGDATLVTKGFADYITAQLRDLDVLRGSNVTQIDYGNEGVGLRLVTGESLSADRVVSTIPLGVLQKRKVVFRPALPDDHLAAIDALGMGVQDVLWLRFDQRYWSTDASVWAVLDESATYRTWLNLEPSTGFPILVAVTGGDSAAETEKLSDTDARNAALGSIVGYFDLMPATSSPTPAPTPSG